MPTPLACLKTKWNGREAYTIQNDLVRMVTLPGEVTLRNFSFSLKPDCPS